MLRSVIECPTDDVLGALVEHALPPDEADRVTAHLDACGACRELVIAAVRGGVATSVTVPNGGPRTLVRAAPRERTSLVGTRIGRYQLEKLLGAGGMGQVYEARDRELERAVAVKVLRPDFVGVADITERLMRESRIMAKVTHPAVITVYDVGREGEIVFIAMELVRGETLASFVARTRPDWREIVGLFERAGHGLAAAHAAGIVHRDFKPDNVLVETAGDRARRLLVTDFGIARGPEMADDAGGRASDGELRLTAAGSTLGTPAYMAPEQLDGKPVDARADVFAFAVSLWEALCGVRPFLGATVAEIRAAMERPPRAPRSLPGPLVSALERGLAIDPAARTADMPALLGELQRIRTRRTRLGRSFAAIGLVGIGVTGALALTHSTSPPAGSAYDARAIAMRACQQWAPPLVAFQRPDGAFALEPQRSATGFTTAQQLFPLELAHRACKVPGPEPLARALVALAAFRTDQGWKGDGRLETPATGWSVLSLVAASIDDPTLRPRVVDARDVMLLAQTADGGFRTVTSDAAAPSNGLSTVMALWALTATEPIVPSPRAIEARHRAARWIRRALVEDLGDPPLRTTAGLHEQAAWVLLHARALDGVAEPDDAALFTRVATEVIARCALDAGGRCTRPLYENGQTYLVHEPGKPPDFSALWHPWVTVLAHELARDEALASTEVRAKLAAIDEWGMREIDASMPSLTTAPNYKLAEYLFVMTTYLGP